MSGRRRRRTRYSAARSQGECGERNGLLRDARIVRCRDADHQWATSTGLHRCPGPLLTVREESPFDDDAHLVLISRQEVLLSGVDHPVAWLRLIRILEGELDGISSFPIVACSERLERYLDKLLVV